MLKNRINFLVLYSNLRKKFIVKAKYWKINLLFGQTTIYTLNYANYELLKLINKYIPWSF